MIKAEALSKRVKRDFCDKIAMKCFPNMHGSATAPS